MKPKELKRLIVVMEPTRYLRGAIDFRIRIDADNTRFEEVKVIEESHFTSIAELALDEAVRRFKRSMGWK